MGWWRKKKRKKQRTLARGAKLLEDLIECCDGKSNPIKFFSAVQIRKATDNFSKSNRVDYFYHEWYSGKNESHHKVLIQKDYFDGQNFSRDIAVSSMVSGHKNFMKLVGCCLEFEGPVIVYNDANKHFKLDISEQPWKRRMKIAEDIATALAYLHTAFPRPFVYRALYPRNILLDEDGVAKLIDFSQCVLIPKGETFVKVDKVVEIYGYLYDINLRPGVVSEKTDVFAFGILMQTLLIGKERYWKIWEEAKEADGISKMNDLLSEFANRLSKFTEGRNMDEIADPEMLEKVGEISAQELCQMDAFVMLLQRCVGHKGEVPTMVEVGKELKKIQRYLKNDSSSPSGETQFDSPNELFDRQRNKQIERTVDQSAERDAEQEEEVEQESAELDQSENKLRKEEEAKLYS